MACCTQAKDYATHIVNLEILGDRDWSGYGPYDDIGEFAAYLRDDVDEMLDDTSGNGFAEGLARRFLADVDWYELAEMYATDTPEVITPEIEECAMCNGSGDCHTCAGLGRDPENIEEMCPDCWKSGECQDCNGTGEIEIPWSPE